MKIRQSNPAALSFRKLRLAHLIGVSIVPMTAAASPAKAQELKPAYSPAADNGGGTAPAETGVIDIFQRATTIDGDYNIRGTSARRFSLVSDTIAERQRRGEVLSGYDAIAGRSALVLTPEQKTVAVTYPDLVQGTRQSAVVYDNDRLIEIASDSARPVTFVDTAAPVYGDLRLANISQLSCPLLSGPSTMTVWIEEGTTNACEEAQARGDHREAA